MKRRFGLMLTGSVLLLAGCHHRAKQVIVLPPAPPEITPVMVSVPPPTHRSEPVPAQIAAVPPPPAVVEPPKKEKRQPRRAAPQSVPTPTPPVQSAAAEPPPIELGALSAGGEANSGLKQETYNLIHALDARVAALPDGVASSHKREIERAKRFLKQAEDSWNTADMDGAHTLAVKAKVLLDDLQK